MMRAAQRIRVPSWFLLGSLLLAGIFLAGCGAKAGTVTEVTIASTASPNATVTLAASATQDQTQGKGHLVGIVVDPAIRPLENAVVKLPNLDLRDDTDRDGAFSFTDLRAGAYLVRVTAPGHDTAETIVDVHPGEFTRVKFILHPTPPPTPKVVVVKHKGHVESFPLLVYSCGNCNMYLHLKDPALHVVVADLVMDAPSAFGPNKFYYFLYDAANKSIENRVVPAPAQLAWDHSRVMNWTNTVNLRAYVGGGTVPELETEYEVFVSSWLNADPPLGWTFQKDGNPYP